MQYSKSLFLQENCDPLMAHSVREAYTKMFDHFLDIVEEKWVEQFMV